MDTITITVTVDESRHLIVPDDILPGRFKLTFERLTNGETSEPENGQPVTSETLTREEARRRLKAAGLLMEFEASPDAIELSQEERERLAKLFGEAGDRPISDLIIEDREERF